MEKTFNRSMVGEISRRIQEVLSTQCKDWDYALTIGNGRFTDDKLSLKLEVRIKTSDGSIAVSATSHSIADSNATRHGLKFSGHIIGSTWNVNGTIYTVTGFNTKRPRYPLSLKNSSGRMFKTSVMFLSQGEQIVTPSLEDFTKWFTMDPDSDAILETDAEICDRVQSYLDTTYPVADGDKFYHLVDLFNEEGIAKKWAKRAYELLFKESNTMETAYLGLKTIYKEETR